MFRLVLHDQGLLQSAASSFEMTPELSGVDVLWSATLG